ncbi:MAG: trypsin-like peptidase domain-containing protein [Candidatus Bathyarchaeota archaeon]|nr:MAG: trypsin-like peptidase domain-containing protein [Candidatus Bathyarchaeota archaeon]
MPGEDEILDILESVNKSVVHINTVRVVRDYYHRTMPLQGSGSGFTLEPEGYIVTNAHVVRQARKIGVVLWDNRPVEGTIMGLCRSIDVALVKIEADGLPSARLGDSDELRVGQRVYAIGNPFGLVGGPTVTSGVVSALDRSIQSRTESFTGLVQTDAAINPGNSGGPLVDTEGKVVAINTAVIPYAQGIGFAIPINTAMECVQQIKTNGRAMRSWVGVYGVTVTPQVASYYNLGVDRGVLVTNVVQGSPAEKSRLTSGDVITAIDRAHVRSTQDLKREIDGKRVGERIELVIVRGRERGTIQLIIEGSP